MIVSGVEALLRWRHPTRGVIAPSQFIPAAEDMGLIVPIGQWVLREAFAQAVQLQRTFPSDPPLTMAVNLSPRQLNQGDIVGDVRRAIRDSGIDPSTLVLEITESLMMADADLAILRLEEMKALGVRLAMDDFGTGYSSLSNLGRFPVDILKMDRSFLESGAEAADAGLAAAVVALGETLDLQVVAEGIELTSQMSSLRDLGCELGQGFLFARPMSIESVARYLSDARGGARCCDSPPSPSRGAMQHSYDGHDRPGGFSRVNLLAPLRHRDFALLWTGQTASLIGDGVFLVAMAWQVYSIWNAPAALSMVGIAMTIPTLLLLLAGGVVSDRFDRRRVLIGADIVRGLAVGAMAVLSLAGALQLWHMFVLVALYGAGTAFFGPAFDAIVPDLLPADQLAQANSLDQLVRPIAFRLVGPALGGWMVAGLGVGTAFALDSATFAISAAAVLSMRHYDGYARRRAYRCWPTCARATPMCAATYGCGER